MFKTCHSGFNNPTFDSVQTRVANTCFLKKPSPVGYWSFFCIFIGFCKKSPTRWVSGFLWVFIWLIHASICMLPTAKICQYLQFCRFKFVKSQKLKQDKILGLFFCILNGFTAKKPNPVGLVVYLFEYLNFVINFQCAFR